MAGSAGRRRRRRRIALLATVLALAGAGAAYFLLREETKSGAGAVPASEVVRKGDVRATVSGVGTLQPQKSVSLGFGAGGRVKSVEVHLGQKVRAGQVLARLDDRLPLAGLGAARSQVLAAEAKVAQLVEGHTPQERGKVAAETAAARRAAAGARRLAAKARAVAAGEVDALRSALGQAQRTHRVAVKRLAGNRSKLVAKQGRTATAKAQMETAKAMVATARAQVVAVAGTKEATRKKAEEEEQKERKRLEEEEKREREKAEAEEREFKGKEVTVIPRNPEAGLGSAEAQAQAQLESAQSELSEAQSTYERFRGETETLRTSLPELRDTARSSAETAATAGSALRSGQASSAQAVRTALDTAATASSAVGTAVAAGAAETQPTKAGELAEALAAVSQAEAAVASNRKGVEETVLRAPAAGRVANLKLAVGDVVSGGSTSQASAAAASASGAETSSGSGGSEAEASASGGSTGSGSSSGGPSIALTSPRLRLFAVSLTQADAVKVKPGDEAKLLIDALGRKVEGRLVSVTPLPLVKNGVVNYTATVATTGLPQQLRVGMTAEVTLLTANRHDVPVLPRAALPVSTGTVSLQVLEHGKREQRQVQLGLAGDESIEVKKGLRPGDRVVLPGKP